jgi:hypothetical protein
LLLLGSLEEAGKELDLEPGPISFWKVSLPLFSPSLLCFSYLSFRVFFSAREDSLKRQSLISRVPLQGASRRISP